MLYKDSVSNLIKKYTYPPSVPLLPAKNRRNQPQGNQPQGNQLKYEPFSRPV
jgi:hypothetical protein